MFERSELKTRAKQIMKKYYLKMLLASVILSLVGYALNSSVQDNELYVGFNVAGYQVSYAFGYLQEMLPYFLLAGLIFFVIRIAIGYPLTYAGLNYFKHLSYDETDLHFLLSGFKRENFKRAILTQLLAEIIIFLSFFLLIIPGIIKSFAYTFVPYIIEDEPELSYMEVLRKSEAMTKGIKFEIFILNLSFMGWYLLFGFLGIITFGLAGYFLLPYVHQTSAELYLRMKEVRKNEVIIEEY